MPAGKHNITVEKGASFRQRFTYKMQDGTPIDISAAVDIQMQVRDAEGGDVLFTATLLTGEFDWETDGSDGVFILVITPEQSTDVPASNKHLYDILLVFSETNIVRILEGQARFNPAITVAVVPP